MAWNIILGSIPGIVVNRFSTCFKSALGFHIFICLKTFIQCLCL
uniref:Uncharacterized protein n=1 Tax=Anguilla anguilla TaxID=7936 RepID=A0A0E9S7W7_ANGAN